MLCFVPGLGLLSVERNGLLLCHNSSLHVYTGSALFLMSLCKVSYMYMYLAFSPVPDPRISLLACYVPIIGLSRRTWSPAKFGPPGPSVAAVCGPPVPQPVPPPSFAYLARQREATVACNFVALLCCKVTVCKLRPTVASYLEHRLFLATLVPTRAQLAKCRLHATSGLVTNGAQLYKSCVLSL